MLNSTSYRNSLAILHNIVLCTIMATESALEFESSRVNSSSFLLVKDHSHIASTEKYINFTPLAKLKVSWNFLLLTLSFCCIPHHRQFYLFIYLFQFI